MFGREGGGLGVEGRPCLGLPLHPPHPAIELLALPLTPGPGQC